jgi:hypothetical protein
MPVIAVSSCAPRPVVAWTQRIRACHARCVGDARCREPAAAYWEYLGPSGSGEVFAETTEATMTVPCEDLRFGDRARSSRQR